MIEPLLKTELEPVARRQRRLRFWNGLAICWLGAACAGLVVFLLHYFTGLPLAITGLVVLLGVLGSAILVWQRSQSWQPDYAEIARRIEQEHPDLHALLLTAVEQQPDPASGRLNYFQERIIREAVEQSRQHNWIEVVPERRLLTAQWAHWSAFGLFTLLCVMAGLFQHKSMGTPRMLRTSVHVSPGNTSIERGNALVVSATFRGPLPPTAELVVTTPEGERRQALVKNLSDPVFGGVLPEVTGDLKYRVEYGNRRTRDFAVKTYEHPRLERADATITYPDYSGWPEKRIPDTRRVSAVEGSRLHFSLQLNKPVAEARLVAKDKTSIPLNVRSNQAAASLDDFTFEASKTYELRLVDADGRTNKIPAQFTIDTLRNRPPELKLAAPRGDVRVSPLEEIAFQGEAWDDFGLLTYGLAYTVGGGETKSVVLGESQSGTDKKKFDYLLSLEKLGIEIDQLVSFYLWAEDRGPDGQVRQTGSDMFFAEVRPFEEIFRQAESGEGEQEQQEGQQQSGNATMKLADLQKQIINATWKLQRQHRTPAPGHNPEAKPSSQYEKDVAVVRQSQEHALGQAETLQERATDPKTKLSLDAVTQHMQKAIEHLQQAAKTPEPLSPAMSAEQAAYQALLKLAAREFQVAQNRSRSGNAAGNQRNQRQLDQLELKQEADRYETQRRASPQSRPEQSEQLTALNRLKELAQRQQDLNERIKELQTALQEAQTAQEREEIRHRLKRLREEEQELLADVDELRQRMEQPINQSRMAEARQQLENTRADMQRASEALQQENASQALAAGRRAQDELQQLRDDFRKQYASEFAEDMREMRREARDLASKQEEIGKELQSISDSKQKKLSDEGQTKELAQQLEQQRNTYTNLLENMRQVSAQAESAEPLLSKQLYDTARKAAQGNLDQTLTLSEELVKRSFLSEAGEVEQRARQELNQLKQGVERAAESVLGNEAEALRMAKRELEELTRQLAPEQTPQGEAAAAGEPKEGEAQERQPRQQAQGSRREGQAQAPSEGQRSEGGEEGGQQQQAKQANAGQTAQGTGNENSERQGTPRAQQQAQRNTRGQSAQAGGSGQSDQTDRSDRSDQSDQPRQGRANNRLAQQLLDLMNQGSPQGGGDGWQGTLLGQEYRQWSERLGNVEEMLEPPELRQEVARVREQARSLRAEFKRHAKEPQWDLVKSQILAPLAEIHKRVSDELARRESNENLVPIDRDPVPARFSELVRKYYEQLGAGQ